MRRRQRRIPIARYTDAPPSSPRSAPNRSGLTLVEMMVAVMIVTIGLLGMVGTSAYLARQVGDGSKQTLVANTIATRTEWVRTIPCASIRDTIIKQRGITEQLKAGTTVNQVRSVAYTVQYRVNNSKTQLKTRNSTIMVPCW